MVLLIPLNGVYGLAGGRLVHITWNSEELFPGELRGVEMPDKKQTLYTHVSRMDYGDTPRQKKEDILELNCPHEGTTLI